MVSAVYREILAAFLWILLYGQRIITASMVHDMIRDDIIALNDIFSHELDGDLRHREMIPINEVLSIMSKPVEELIALLDVKDKVSYIT
jgi:hypothetical protein